MNPFKVPAFSLLPIYLLSMVEFEYLNHLRSIRYKCSAVLRSSLSGSGAVSVLGRNSASFCISFGQSIQSTVLSSLGVDFHSAVDDLPSVLRLDA